MIPFDRRPASDPPLDKVEAVPPSRRGTLPPPEWTPEASTSRTTLTPGPLPRRTGSRADEAWMRARVDETQSAGDVSGHRAACATLARWLASRDRDLDEAVS